MNHLNNKGSMASAFQSGVKPGLTKLLIISFSVSILSLVYMWFVEDYITPAIVLAITTVVVIMKGDIRLNKVSFGLAVSALVYMILIIISCHVSSNEHFNDPSAFSGSADFIAEGVLGGFFWQLGINILLAILALSYRWHRLMWGFLLGWLIPLVLIGGFFLLLSLGGGIHVGM
jgi:Na+-translocating ferredoxin:NAD+ oxidoreductase RnfE subunit